MDTPSLLFQPLSHLLLTLFPHLLLVPMEYDRQSSEPVVFHSRKQHKLAGEDRIEVEISTIANESHALSGGEHQITHQLLDDKYENQAELVPVPKRHHLGYFSTV